MITIKKSTALKSLFGLLLGITLLTALTLFFLSDIIKIGAARWLTEQGVTLNVENIQINYLDAQIEITDAKANSENKNNNGFNIGKAYLEFSWAPLQSNQFIITGIELIDISIDIDQYDDGLIASGISVPVSDSSNAIPKPKSQPAENVPWNIALTKLTLRNIDICYQQFSGSINKTGDAKKLPTDICIELGDLNWQGDVNYTLFSEPDETKLPLHINGEISLNDIKLTNNHFDAQALSFEHLTLNEVIIKLQKKPIASKTGYLPLQLDTFELSGFDTCFQKSATKKTDNALDGYCFAFGLFSWAGDAHLTPARNPNEKTQITLAGNLGIDAISIMNQHLNKQALGIGVVRISALAVNTFNDISVDKISIQKFEALQKPSTEDQHLLSFDELSIQPIDLQNQNKLTINEVSLDGLQISVTKDNNGQLEFGQWLPPKNPKTPAAENSASKSTETTDDSVFNYAINTITVTNSKELSFVDRSLKEDFTALVNKLELTLGPLDSENPEQNTQHTLSASIYKHGSINTSGTISPLTPEHTFNVEGKLRALDLRKFNPHVKASISHIIASGQLDSDFILKATKGQLDSNIDLTLHKFELEALDEQAAKELNDTFGLPLNPSLALIRERDGSININVDVDGDADNPNFNPIEIVTKSISTSIAKAVVVLYSPYGLVVGADVLFDLATALNFDPIIFDAGSTEINTANTEEFANLSQLLKEKPQVHITLCGSTSNADKASFGFSNTKKEETLDNELIDELHELAKNRAIATKKYLIEKEKLAADRIIVCTHKRKNVETSTVSGVEVSI